jgi:hypothetical protein
VILLLHQDSFAMRELTQFRLFQLLENLRYMGRIFVLTGC